MIFGLLDHVNLAATLNSRGRFDEALNACKLGLNLGRDRAELLAQAARASLGLERPADAIAACEAALHLEPGCREALIQLAFARRLAGESEAALAAARDAVALDPSAEDAHCALATLLLWDGRSAEGLAEQEWHWRREAELLANRFGPERMWDGRPSPDLRLLVAHEQGFGDLFFAARHLRALRERVGSLTLECPAQAVPVLRSVAGIDALVVKGPPLESGSFDRYVRLMSLPRLLAGEDPEPYASAEPERAARWRARFARDGAALRAGIVWAGNPAHTNDRDRSVPAAAFGALAGLPGIRWYSLQVGTHADDPIPSLDVVRCGPELDDFGETAAAIAALDLIVCVDTAVAHLAGALGKPVRLLLGARPDWRWMLEGDRSRWYPRTRLVRRRLGGTWAAAFEELRAELAAGQT